MLQICLARSFLSSGYPAVAIGLDAKGLKGFRAWCIAVPAQKRGLGFIHGLGVCGVSLGFRVSSPAEISLDLDVMALKNARQALSSFSSCAR